MSTMADSGYGVADAFAEFFASGLPRNGSSTGLESSRLVCAGECYLISFTVLSTNVAAQYVQLFDRQTIPGAGVVPDAAFGVSAASDKIVAYSLPGRHFRSGIVIANSTTAGTRTAGAADCFFDVQFIPVTAG